MTQYKRCTLCLQNKPLEAFHTDLSKKDGKTERCSTCRNILSNAYRIDKKAGTWTSKKKPKLTEQQLKANRNAYSRSINHILVFKNSIQRAKAFGAFVGTFTKREIKKLYSSPCFYCNSFYRISIDHVIPLAKGGTHTIGNLVSCCGPCNASKKNNFITVWKKVSGL